LKCARCGEEIPEGRPSCPGCGLKVRMRAPEAGTPPPGLQAPPTPDQPESPPLTEVHPEQEPPPGAIQVTEPSAPGEWPPRDLRVGTPSQPDQAKRKIPKAVIAIIVIGLLVLGGRRCRLLFHLEGEEGKRSGGSGRGFPEGNVRGGRRERQVICYR